MIWYYGSIYLQNWFPLCALLRICDEGSFLGENRFSLNHNFGIIEYFNSFLIIISEIIIIISKLWETFPSSNRQAAELKMKAVDRHWPAKQQPRETAVWWAFRFQKISALKTWHQQASSDSYVFFLSWLSLKELTTQARFRFDLATASGNWLRRQRFRFGLATHLVKPKNSTRWEKKTGRQKWKYRRRHNQI